MARLWFTVLCFGCSASSDFLASARADDAKKAPLQKIDEPLQEPFTRISVDGRVMELIHGEHLDDVLRDTPDASRPPSLIYFHDSTAPAANGKLPLDEYLDIANANALPERDQLLMAQYDVGIAPTRLWFHMIPERNLTHRYLRTLGIAKLPVFVYIPRECSGWTKWCDPGGPLRVVGGECYQEACSGWEAVEADTEQEWVKIVKQKLDDQPVKPTLFKNNKDMEEQGFWLRSRDTCTTREHVNLLQQARSLPRFTKMGFKMLKTPEALQKKLIEFYLEHRNSHATEPWNEWGQTQLNGHETQSTLVDIQAATVRSRYFDQVKSVMQPLLEKWVGLELEFTSLYGMREYRHPAALRHHLDRPDVLVVSCTFSVYQEGFNHSDWPLQVISFDGQTYRYEHPMGSVMLYESATLSHGKPDRLPGGVHAGLFLHFRPKNWQSEGYGDLAKMRAGRSVRREPDGTRKRARHQEGWAQHFHDEADKPADMHEGRYQIIENICGDPADQRNDSVALNVDTINLGDKLLEACKGRASSGVVESLLANRADANFVDRLGWRPIHEAARAGSVAVIKLLVENGAKLSALTNSKHSAWDYAKEFHPDNTELLSVLTPGLEGSEL